MQRIGVFGGTFDPVHSGHVNTALSLAQHLDLAFVHMVPCFQPVHRDAPSTPADHRFAMLERVCHAHPTLIADDRELRRGGPSYSIDTMHALREERPESAIFMVMGADAFRYFESWHRADEFLSVVNIVVVHRGGQPAPDIVSSRWRDAYRSVDDAIQCSLGALTSVQLPLWTISSTAIRRTLADGGELGTEVPEAVAQYIELHQLYR
ncbi:MAG TPA: nicotinate-nucleotide adenylyltransferase [Pseudomonadales bacterium]|nr:nicotinate-nucleotide adenylyltransferase [Pseudomonadales bacterium]